MNTINDAKKSSNERSAELYFDAVENSIANYQIKNPAGISDGIYKINSAGNICLDNSCTNIINIDVNNNTVNGGIINILNGNIDKSVLTNIIMENNIRYSITDNGISSVSSMASSETWFMCINNGDGTCMLSGITDKYDTNQKVLIVPETINGLTVTSISKNTFTYVNPIMTEFKNIETIILPSTINTIQGNAFYTLPNLKNVSFLGLNSNIISNSIFNKCDKLETVYVSLIDNAANLHQLLGVSDSVNIITK